MSKKPDRYTIEQMEIDLGGMPDNDDIRRLVKRYPSYKLGHRSALLHGLLDGKEHAEIVDETMKAKGVESAAPHQKGGHGRWVAKKVRKVALRLLYLRYRIDEKMSKKHARDKLINEHPHLAKTISRSALGKQVAFTGEDSEQ